jgi:O-antigen/teichoic acid export membrane protein
MKPDNAIINRVMANAGALLGGRVVNALLGLAYIALTARALGAVTMGVLVLINAYAQFLGEVVKFQSWQTVLNYGAAPLMEKDRPRLQQVIRFALLLDLIGSVAGVLLGVAGAYLFSPALGWPNDMEGPAALYALSIFAMTSATAVGLLRLLDKFRWLAGEQAVSSGVRLIGCGIAFWLHAPIGGFLLAWALGSLASFLYLAGLAWREMGRRGLLQGFTLTGPLSAGLTGVWRFAGATNFSSSLDVAFTHIVTLAVGAVMGPAPAALWRIGRQVADGLAKPARLLIPALYPELAKLRAAGGIEQMRSLAVRVGLLGGAAAGLLLFITAIAGKPLLGLVMGQAFVGASDVMTWQVAAAAVSVLALPIEPMLVTMGAAGTAMRVRLAVCIAYLVVLVPLVKPFGLRGAGAALLAAMVMMTVGMFFKLRQTLRAGRPA